MEIKFLSKKETKELASSHLHCIQPCLEMHGGEDQPEEELRRLADLYIYGLLYFNVLHDVPWGFRNGRNALIRLLGTPPVFHAVYGSDQLLNACWGLDIGGARVFVCYSTKGLSIDVEANFEDFATFKKVIEVLHARIIGSKQVTPEAVPRLKPPQSPA